MWGTRTPPSRVLIFVTEVKPGAPGRPTLSPQTSSETGNPGLDASWTAADGNGLTLTGYQVRYRKQGDAEWTPYGGTLAASATSTTLPDLEETTTYEAQVRAVGNIGAPADIFLSVDKASLRERTRSYDVTVTATRQGTSGARDGCRGVFGHGQHEHRLPRDPIHPDHYHCRRRDQRDGGPAHGSGDRRREGGERDDHPLRHGPRG